MSFSEDLKNKVYAEENSSWWKPADKEVMRLFQQEHAAYDRKIVRFGFWVAVLTYVSFGIGDIYLFPSAGHSMLLARLVCGIFFLGIFEFAEYKGASLDILHWIASAAIIVGSSSWLFASLQAVDQLTLSQFMVFGTIFVLGANLFFNFKLSLSAFTSSTVTVVFVVTTLCFVDVSWTTKILLAVFYVNITIFSLYLSRRLSVERYHTFLHALQAKFQERLALERKEELKRVVEIDKLTGLKNRIAISREYVNLSRQRLSATEQIGVFLVDIENLVRVEKRLGKKIYEETLIRLARTLNETAAAHSGIVGRFGDNEFIVLARVTSDEHLEIIGQQIRDCVNSILVPGDNGEQRSTSLIARIGATATRNDANMDFTAILKEAERAVFMGRSEAVSTFRVFDPAYRVEDALNQSVVDLLTGKSAETSLQVNYTPVFDRRSEIVRGYEAEISLLDKNGSVVCPEILSVTAEGVGELLVIAGAAVERVCSDLVTVEDPHFVALKMHPAYFRDPSFVDRFRQIVSYYGVSSSSLAFVIADHANILSETQVQKNLEELGGMGVQFWLDNFGTLNVGLDWVRRYDFNVVKIDPSLMNEIHLPKVSTFLEDLTRLLKNTGTQVLLTGIESEHQKVWALASEADLLEGDFMVIANDNRKSQASSST